jgi:hypothetical protein
LNSQKSYVAFAGSEQVAAGNLGQVAEVVKTLIEARDPRAVLAFAEPTGEQVDLDLRGSLAEVLARIDAPSPSRPAVEPVPRPRGRPRLGVVGREVTLLPRHWEWLNVQPGGASVALRKLVERARNTHRDRDRLRLAREAAYRFMSAIAGNEPGFEEACRALFADDEAAFATHTGAWPVDVREFARRLAAGAPDPEPHLPSAKV